MNTETLILLVVFAAFCCYLVYRWQEAIVDMADPPYQSPVGKCTQDCRQGRDCTCFQQSCDQTVQEFDSKLNPKATWPFPSGDKP